VKKRKFFKPSSGHALLMQQPKHTLLLAPAHDVDGGNQDGVTAMLQLAGSKS
jgi:hypothetical protein